jgi:ABC-type polysaccharide/polyol phosphate export permease
MLIHTLRLSIALAIADFKLRNEGSYLGVLWYLLNPLLMFSLLLFVFLGTFGKGVSNYPLYLLLGIIMFNFFRQATMETARTVFENKWLIKSINFPRQALIYSVVLKALFSHIFELIVFSFFLLFFKLPLISIVFYLLIVILFCFFIIGVSLILSTLIVYLVDLENIWLFATQLLWFATPIFYTVEKQTILFKLNLLNPMYYFITIARDVLIYTKTPELWMILGVVGYTVTTFLLGIIIFNKFGGEIAEMI